MHDLKIRTKLVFAFIIISIVFSIPIYFMLKVDNANNRSLTLLDEIISSVETIRLKCFEHLGTFDPKKLASINEYYNNEAKKTEGKLKDQKSLFDLSDDEERMFNKLSNLFDKSIKDYNIILDLNSSFQQKKAYNMIIGNSQNDFNELIETVYSLKEAKRNKLNLFQSIISILSDLKIVSDDQYTKPLITNLLVITLIFFMAILVIYYLSSLLVIKPIRYLYNFTQAISSGDINQRSRLTRHDEIGHLGLSINEMLDRLQAFQSVIVEQEKVKQEMEIAQKIQTSLLPHLPTLKRYEIAATMIPATEVGGDYYDFILGQDKRLWFGIGDVSGHGLTAGLVMMMTQSVVSSIIHVRPMVSPDELIVILNHVMHENIKLRLQNNSYMTLSVLVDNGNGNFEFAGAHLDILVYRSSEDRVEKIKTSGVWIGIIPDISEVTKKFKFDMGKGDIMLLYTDGLIEAKDEAGNQFDVDRLISSLKKYHHLTSSEIKSKIIEDVMEFLNTQLDDITLVVVKRTYS